MSVVLSEPITLDLTPRQFVYRQWAKDGTCLYVGSHRGFSVANRIREHRWQSPWYGEIARVDYLEILEGDLDIAEKQVIADLNPAYNNGGYYRLHPRSALPPEDVPERAVRDGGDDFREFLRGLIAEYVAHLDASVQAVLDQLIQGHDGRSCARPAHPWRDL